MSAAFSAIIITGALILPLIRSGITEASMTRNRSTPRTRRCGSTTALSSSSRPILHQPHAGAQRLPLAFGRHEVLADADRRAGVGGRQHQFPAALRMQHHDTA